MDVSNKFLVVLLVIAIVITLVGTWYAVDKINKLGFISGADFYGFVNISISNQTTINVTATNCNFGTGHVTAPYVFAVLYPGVELALEKCAAADSGSTTKANWTNTTTYTPKCMVVRNDGNINLTINVSSGKNTDEFLGGTAAVNEYKVWSESKESWNPEMEEIWSCESGAVNHPGTEMDKSNITICNKLQSYNEVDELYVGCYLKIPDNACGTKGDIWTFWASPSA